MASPFTRSRAVLVAFTLAFLGARLMTLFALGAGSGTVSITALESPLAENFDTLANTPNGSATNTLPAGWFIDESGTSARNDGKYTVGTGSDNAGDTFAFGSAAGNTDRALGTLRSGTLSPTIGASFTNNSGAAIGSLSIAYTGEQWRLGTAGRADRLDFQISVDATSITTGTWTNVDALDFSSPVTTAPTGALNGNLAANRTAISSTIAGLNIPDGAAFWIRWLDFDASGADDGLAVDDFSLTAHAFVPTPTNPSGIGAANPSNVPAGTQTVLSVTVTPGTLPASTGLVVTADLSSIGGSSTQPFFDDGISPDATAGDNVFTYLATVSPLAPQGPLSLPVAIADDQGRHGSASIAIVVQPPPPPPPPLIAIHDVQGSGSRSPVEGQTVRAQGVVTALKSNGFFMQTPDDSVDADPNTSEGIFVFTSSAPPATAAIGNLVEVTGRVQEFIPSADPNSPPSTEFAATNPPIQIARLSTGNPLPAPVTIAAADTSPSGSIEQLEKYEGMRVHVDSLTVVGPTQGNVNEPNATSTSTGIFYGVITGVARPFREPGVEVPDPLPAGAPANVPRWDANPERLAVDSDAQPGATALEVMSGAVVTNITGVLDYASRTYTIDPDPSPTPAVGGLHAFTAVRAPAPFEFTIGTANLEHFYDTVNDPGTSDAVLTATALANRLNKASLEIRKVMQTPDIVGVEEMENLATLQALADKINADAVADGGASPQYQPYLVEGNDIGGIDVGLLVKSTRVTVIDVTQIGKDATYVDPTNPTQTPPPLLNDRPPLVLRATLVDPDTHLGHLDVTVIVNHLRSLLSIDDDTPGGDGPRVRAKRQAQAEFLANLIQAHQAAGERVISIGDYNAFTQSDGYVDVIGTIKGTPVPADQVVINVSSPGLVNPAATNLVELATGDQQPYSYVFGGTAQELDHVIVTSGLLPLFDEIEFGRVNADFPESFRGDPSRPERLSDHDPVVAYFRLPEATTAQVAASPDAAALNQPVTLTASLAAEFGPVDGGTVTFNDGATAVSSPIVVSGGQASAIVSLAVGSHSITAVYTGTAGFSSSTSDAVTVTVVIPTLTLPGDLVAEATTASGAAVGFTASGSELGSLLTTTCVPAAGATFPIGTTVVGCSATDGFGNTVTGGFSVTVRDTTAPAIDAHADVSAEANKTGGAIVAYTAPAVHDLVDGTSAASCAPASGSLFALGSTVVTCQASDLHGNAATPTTFTVKVVDTTPPAVTQIATTPAFLLPIGILVPVTVNVHVTDVADPAPACSILGIASSAGNIPGDIVVTGPLTARLRARRTSTGVLYLILVGCTDRSGNQSFALTAAFVLP